MNRLKIFWEHYTLVKGRKGRKALSERYNSIIGRGGIALLVIGLFLILRPLAKLHGALSKVLVGFWVPYLGAGLVIIGGILIASFVTTFMSKQKKHKSTQSI